MQRTSSSSWYAFCALGLSLVLGACSSESSPSEPIEDASAGDAPVGDTSNEGDSSDATNDAAADAPNDAVDDAAGEDAEEDAVADSGDDVAGEDAGGDAVTDSGDDAAADASDDATAGDTIGDSGDDVAADASDDETTGDATTVDAVADSGGDAADDADGSLPCGLVMRRIPGGTFTPTRAPGLPVTVESFCMDRFEVKVGSYRACVVAGLCDPLPETLDERCNARVSGRDAHPLDCVDYARAAQFCAFMGKRLPTSDELEWAMRGASADGVYPWGTQDPTATDAPPRLCWAHTSPDHTCFGGSYPAGDSPQGISDLAGNVWEWSSTPGDGPGTRRVHGGAHWNAAPLDPFKASYSESLPETTLVPSYGFRCVQ